MIRRTAMAFVISTASFLAHANEPAKAPAAAAPAAAPAAAAPAADLAKGQAIAAGVCAACHSADGNSLIPTNPILAGQHRDYLLKQMTNFKSVDGKPAARMSPIMNGMIMAVPNEDMKSVAEYFASQTVKPAAAKDEKLAAAGQKLWRAGDFAKGIPACAGCHGASGSGLPAQFPRLAGQHADYTEAQLKAFRAGDRANDNEKVMRMIAAKMSDSQIKAVSEYAAGLR
jgi:cytochrome c553